MITSKFFITSKLSYQGQGIPYIITPEVLDDDGNVIKEAVWEVPPKTYYKPKLAEKYKGCKGWLSSKYNDNYYIIQVFADSALHDKVISELTSDYGIYLGQNLQEAKDKIDTNVDLSILISSEKMVEGQIGE